MHILKNILITYIYSPYFLTHFLLTYSNMILLLDSFYSPCMNDGNENDTVPPSLTAAALPLLPVNDPQNTQWMHRERHLTFYQHVYWNKNLAVSCKKQIKKHCTYISSEKKKGTWLSRCEMELTWRRVSVNPSGRPWSVTPASANRLNINPAGALARH